MNTRSRDLAFVVLVATVARVAIILWAGTHFPATADGAFYERLAERLAAGEGYTWAWPDGAVTPAAHYPVGYPALLALGFRLFGARLAVAETINAAIGVAGAAAAFSLASRAMPRRAAVVAATWVAIDPALLLYTPAVMTEGITASLLMVAAAFSGIAANDPRRSAWWIAALAVTTGIATLIRPQSLLFAPCFGALASPRAPRARLFAAAAALAGALLVCLPWTLRNCFTMHRCALVSVNGGWNLLIGIAPGATGHWSFVKVPPECANVFDEAAKDVCFGDVARRMILADPIRFIALVPKKLSAVFDYCGAAAWYLHDAGPAFFGERAKMIAGAVETVVHRGALVLALVAAARGKGPSPQVRVALAVVGIVAALLGAFGDSHRGGAIAHLALAGAFFALGRSLFHAPTLAGATAFSVALTAVVHAIFFGAGRYGLVVFPFVTATAGALLTGMPPKSDTSRHAAD